MKKIDFYDIYGLPSRNLKNVTRYSGKTLLLPESVSDHISDMISMGLHIIGLCRDQGIEIDKKDLIYRISLHDFDESILCDLPRNFKYYDPKFRGEVERVIQLILTSNFSDEIITDINESKSERSFEGVITHLLDVVQATCTLYREVVELGNKTLEWTLKDNLNYVRQFYEKIDENTYLKGKEIKFLKEYVKPFINIKL